MLRRGSFLILFTLVLREGQGAPVSFVKELVPILADQCVTCHEEKKAKGDYRVDNYEGLLKAGDSESPPVVPGKPDDSLFYQRLVTHDEDERMPQKGDPLPAPQIELFKRWIAEGAKFDGPNAKASLADLAPKTEAPAAPAAYNRPVPITAIEWMKDGRTLVASGYREVVLWDADTGKMVKRIGGMPERVLSLSLHPEGKLLAVAGGIPGRSGERLIVNLDDGKVVKRLPGTKDTVLAVAFSADGRFLASGGTDNVLRIFRPGDWSEAWKAEAHADWITSVTFSPDSKHLVSTSRDRTARVFQSENGTPEAAQTGHGGAVVAAIFDKEGKSILSASSNELRRWEPLGGTDGNGSPTSKVIGSPRQDVTRLGFTAAGLFTANSEGKTMAYDLAKQNWPRELMNAGKRLNVLAVSPDGQRVALGTNGGEVTVFNASDPKVRLTWVASPGLQPAP